MFELLDVIKPRTCEERSVVGLWKKSGTGYERGVIEEEMRMRSICGSDGWIRN